MSFKELQGRLVSISCIPSIEDPCYPEMVEKLKSVFSRYQENGIVISIVISEYQTEIYSAKYV